MTESKCYIIRIKAPVGGLARLAPPVPAAAAPEAEGEEGGGRRRQHREDHEARHARLLRRQREGHAREGLPDVQVDRDSELCDLNTLQVALLITVLFNTNLRRKIPT